MHVGMIPEKAW